jgi:hypothetical protein
MVLVVGLASVVMTARFRETRQLNRAKLVLSYYVNLTRKAGHGSIARWYGAA